MAQKTEKICGNCGKQTVLFCDNEFTNELCTSCGAKNLFVALRKLESRFKCKDDKPHDIRIAKGNKIFCPKCRTDFGVLSNELIGDKQ